MSGSPMPREAQVACDILDQFEKQSPQTIARACVIILATYAASDATDLDAMSAELADDILVRARSMRGGEITERRVQ